MGGCGAGATHGVLGHMQKVINISCRELMIPVAAPHTPRCCKNKKAARGAKLTEVKASGI